MIGRNGTSIGALGLARGVVDNNDRSVSDLNRAACTGSGKSCICLSINISKTSQPSEIYKLPSFGREAAKDIIARMCNIISKQAFIGFDSAWTDNPRSPGAICAILLQEGQAPVFHAPRLATFADALTFIRTIQEQVDFALVAIDQPTVVRNTTGQRPVERPASSLISWLGGGVQPANRSRVGMFCDAAPIWPFLDKLNAQEDPEQARMVSSGLHVMEVFPALALPSLSPAFFGRLAAPKYNPARRKTYRPRDWVRVVEAVALQFEELHAKAPAAWCREVALIGIARKADQDRLDAMICLFISMHWRLRDRSASMLLGNLEDGYMVLPASADVRLRLTETAARMGVEAK
jgi:predicted RNase H-like nuclease